MTVEAIAAISGALASTPSASAATSVKTVETPSAFDAILKQIEGLNTQMAASQQLSESLAVGDTDNLHRVMIQLERTKLQFELALQVRNKVLDAYQELMRMQV